MTLIIASLVICMLQKHNSSIENSVLFSDNHIFITTVYNRTNIIVYNGINVVEVDTR